MSLTKAEKAARYDALQVAIRYMAKQYRTRRTECLQRYEAYGADSTMLGAYNKGMADAFEVTADVLERWCDRDQV